METEKATVLENPRTCALIYAQPGMGKTTAVALQKGRKLIIDLDRSSVAIRSKDNILTVEGLQDQLKDIDIVSPKSIREFVDILKELEDGAAKKYDIIAVDNITELERRMLGELGQTGKNDGVPELQHYNKVQFKMNDFITRFRDLPADIIFTAWETKIEVADETGVKYTLAYPMVMKKIVDRVCGLCNVVGRLECKTDATGETKRRIRLSADNCVYAKDQLRGRKACRIEDLIGGDAQ